MSSKYSGMMGFLNWNSDVREAIYEGGLRRRSADVASAAFSGDQSAIRMLKENYSGAIIVGEGIEVKVSDLKLVGVVA